MKSISMTSLLGASVVLGVITVVILAHGQDRDPAPVTTQCKTPSCPIGVNDRPLMRKMVLKSTLQSDRSDDDPVISDKPRKNVEAMKSLPPRRISCGKGRAIVAARFNRVRVVECRGGTYTYLGRRRGETFRVLINPRTGRIIGRAPL